LRKTNVKNKKFWQFRAAAEPGVGVLLLYGEISDITWFGDEVTPKQFWNELQNLGVIKELKVYINSPGGDVFAGQAIYSMLSRYQAQVTVYVDGLAASAASLIAMAGDRVIMPRNAMMMIHNPWTYAWGDANAFLQIAAELEKIREAMIPVYQAKTGLTKDEISKLLDAETWMTASEAVELGFADEIEEAKQVAASIIAPGRMVVNGMEFDLTRYQRPPQPFMFDDLKRKIYNGVVPEDVSRELAPEDTPWEAPDLEDFTDKSWDELTDEEKREIAGHFAWAPEMPPSTYTDLKLPHHRPSDGAVVWAGVVAAAQRLDQTDIPEADKERVRQHLASHYHQFGRRAPWERDDEAENKLKMLKLELELLTGSSF